MVKAMTFKLGLAENFNVTMQKGQANAIKTQLVVQPKLTAPLKKGQVIGKFVASIDGKSNFRKNRLLHFKMLKKQVSLQKIIDHIKQFFSNLF